MNSWAVDSDAKIPISSASSEDRASRADIAASFQVSHYVFIVCIFTFLILANEFTELLAISIIISFLFGISLAEVV